MQRKNQNSQNNGDKRPPANRNGTAPSQADPFLDTPQEDPQSNNAAHPAPPATGHAPASPQQIMTIGDLLNYLIALEAERNSGPPASGQTAPLPQRIMTVGDLINYLLALETERRQAEAAAEAYRRRNYERGMAALMAFSHANLHLMGGSAASTSATSIQMPRFVNNPTPSTQLTRPVGNDHSATSISAHVAQQAKSSKTTSSKGKAKATGVPTSKPNIDVKLFNPNAPETAGTSTNPYVYSPTPTPESRSRQQTTSSNTAGQTSSSATLSAASYTTAPSSFSDLCLAGLRAIAPASTPATSNTATTTASAAKISANTAPLAAAPSPAPGPGNTANVKSRKVNTSAVTSGKSATTIRKRTKAKQEVSEPPEPELSDIVLHRPPVQKKHRPHAVAVVCDSCGTTSDDASPPTSLKRVKPDEEDRRVRQKVIDIGSSEDEASVEKSNVPGPTTSTDTTVGPSRVRLPANTSNTNATAGPSRLPTNATASTSRLPNNANTETSGLIYGYNIFQNSRLQVPRRTPTLPPPTFSSLTDAFRARDDITDEYANAWGSFTSAVPDGYLLAINTEDITQPTAQGGSNTVEEGANPVEEGANPAQDGADPVDAGVIPAQDGAAGEEN